MRLLITCLFAICFTSALAQDVYVSHVEAQANVLQNLSYDEFQAMSIEDIWDMRGEFAIHGKQEGMAEILIIEKRAGKRGVRVKTGYAITTPKHFYVAIDEEWTQIKSKKALEKFLTMD